MFVNNELETEKLKQLNDKSTDELFKQYFRGLKNIINLYESKKRILTSNYKCLLTIRANLIKSYKHMSKTDDESKEEAYKEFQNTLFELMDKESVSKIDSNWSDSNENVLKIDYKTSLKRLLLLLYYYSYAFQNNVEKLLKISVLIKLVCVK